MENTGAAVLSEEHHEMLNTIRHWESQLDSMGEQNGEIVTKAIEKDAKKKVDHFDNQFSIQKGELDKMKHNIKIYGGDIATARKELDDYVSYLTKLKDEFSAFADQY